MSDAIARLSSESGQLIFERAGGGLPSRLLLNHPGTTDTLLSCALEIILEDGRRIRPGTTGTEPIQWKDAEAECLEFTDLAWFDEQGNRIPDFHLALRHELYSDGAFFTTAMLHAETSAPPAIRNFQLVQTLHLDTFDEVRAAAVLRRGRYASSDIQTVTPRQIFEAGENRSFPDNQMVSAGFYATKHHGADLYGEFFLESGATLSGNMADGSSEVRWNGRSPSAVWHFQNKPAHTRCRPWQWRNRWGWIIAPPPARRRLPPQQIYQYIDNYRHYPDQAELASIADAACQVLVLHSNWRRDAKNDGVPYDRKRFREIVDFAHARGIRIAVYVRGNEKEIRESAAAWFPRYLRRDFDGLYMDYGSPLSQDEPANEDYPGGSVCFYRHYRNLRRLRERVGEHGILISHTGGDFSALGLSLTDGYISGEAERGILIRNRREHEYFTMAAAAVGTLWSAAFPEYSTMRIIPFLAAAGQAPHSPLGVQFKSSSLRHPPVPGINDAVFRPLWRLWSVFAKESDITVFNDCNSEGIFGSGPGRGHYLMISKDRKRALLVVSSFSAENTPVHVEWSRTSFDPAGKICRRLRPGLHAPGEAELWKKHVLDPGFQEYPAMAFFWSAEEENWDPYRTAYPPCGAKGMEYLKEVEDQRAMRSAECNRGNLLFRVIADNSICTSLEDTNFFDLYDNTLELVILHENGKTEKIGEIGKKEFYRDKACPGEDRLLPGDTSAEFSLNELLPPGRRRLGVRSLHFGEPFYSLISVQLKDADQPDAPWRQLDFYNELEADRALLTWECEIRNPGGSRLRERKAEYGFTL